MPRASHFSQQVQLESKLLRQALDVVRATDLTAVSLPGGLRRVLNKVASGEVSLKSECVSDAVRGHIPLLLGWEPVVAVGKELGIHRNTVVSFLKHADAPKDVLLLAQNQLLYVAPEGVEFVKEKAAELAKLRNWPTTRRLANQLKVSTNVVRQWLTVNQIDVQMDPLGRIRVPPNVVPKIVEWRQMVCKRSDPPIRTEHNGVDFILTRISARRRAGLFILPENPAFERLSSQLQRSLEMRLGGTNSGYKFVKGGPWYAPLEWAQQFAECIHTPAAARLVGVALVTMKKWAQEFPSIVWQKAADDLRMPRIIVSELICLSDRKYRSEIHLKDRDTCPAVGLSFVLHEVAFRSCCSERALIESVFRGDEEQKFQSLFLSCQGRVSTIERSQYEHLIGKFASLLQCDSSMSELVQTIQRSTPSTLRLLLARSLPSTPLFSKSFFTASVEAAKKARDWENGQVEELLDKIVPGRFGEGCSAQQALFLDLLQDRERGLFSPLLPKTSVPKRGDLYVDPDSNFYGICKGIDKRLDFVAAIWNPATDQERLVPLVAQLRRRHAIR